LAAQRLPRLLLVDERSTAPLVLSAEEDWIRVPADERDLYTRIARLERRHRTNVSRPQLEHGVLRNLDRSVVLSPIETTIVALLLGNFGRLVSKDAVISAVWEDGRAHALNTRLHRLRDRLAVVGLRLVTVRGRGFVLECDVTEDG
jgi:two-component system response regulator TctD